jgi:uncharacterized protein YceK
MTYVNCGPALLQGPQKEQGTGMIYGGVRADCALIRDSLANKCGDADAEQSAIAAGDLSRTAKVFLACLYYLDRSFMFIDLPLCVVADTLTLPYTISYTLRCRALKREADRQATVSDDSPESVKEP